MIEQRPRSKTTSQLVNIVGAIVVCTGLACLASSKYRTEIALAGLGSAIGVTAAYSVKLGREPQNYHQ